MNRELLETADIDKELIAVLYYLPDNKYTPWVTWAARKDSPQNTFWGHYFQTLEDAQADFDMRAFERSHKLNKVLDALEAPEESRRDIYRKFRRY